MASAVAKQYQAATRDQRPMVVVSTASPYKFPQAVLTAITGELSAVDGRSVLPIAITFSPISLIPGLMIKTVNSS
ncbi:hypothetical protein WP50_36975 [Lactiplantibacillus plantarum]|nr:hypothetical protein WP50_36975 [Lactiplantibacillus plantarum]